MKTHRVITLAAGAMLLLSTFFPVGHSNMWNALKLLEYDVITGLLPVIMTIGALTGIVAGFLDRGVFALIAGLLAFIWTVIATRFTFFVFFIEPYFFLSLIGSVAMTAGGITTIVYKRHKNT